MIDYYDAELQFKTVSLSQRLISGWAARHHSIDRVRDIIDPVASEKAVKRLKSPSDVGVFVGHNSQMLPVGIPQKIEATPQGLYTETYILKGPAGDNLLAVAKDLADHGLSLGMSIGYKTHDSKMEQTAHGRVRRLLDLALVEFSYAASQAIAHPEALVTGVKARREAGGARREGSGGMQYRIQQQGERYAVIGQERSVTNGDSAVDDDTMLVGTYPSAELAEAVAGAMQTIDDEASGVRRQASEGGDEAPENRQGDDMGGKTQDNTSVEGQQSAPWDAAHLATLPDECYLHVEPGDQEEGKTVPLSKRHFAYRSAPDAAPDACQLRHVLERLPYTKAEGLDEDKKTHLATRARRMLDQLERGQTPHEPAEWKSGAPLELWGLGCRVLDLSERLATELKALALLGEETKDYRRIRQPLRDELRAVAADLGKVLDFAETCERGEDGQQRLAWLRQQLALTEV